MEREFLTQRRHGAKKTAAPLRRCVRILI